MFVKLSPKQVGEKIAFIYDYMKAENAASGSAVDANANVSSKNICTLVGELHKDFNIQIKRSLVTRKITELYGESVATEYLRQIDQHEIYPHDESSLSAYTYSSQESISVIHNGKKVLTSMSELYSMVDEDEELLDSVKGVWGKYPSSLFITDIDGKITKVNRLIKKQRHRDLYRVKTAYGEDLFVTDNHPMITSKIDINNTIEAKDSLGAKQFREKISTQFTGITSIDLGKEEIFSDCEDFGTYITSPKPNIRTAFLKKNIELNEEFGYVVGMFIAEGYLSNNIWTIVQKDKKILEKVASYLYSSTGAVTYIVPIHNNDGREDVYHLTNTNELLVRLFKDVLGIQKYSENKNLPINIFEYSPEFAKGVVAGIIDGDGTISGKFLSIRVSSRSLISQLMTVLSSFDVSTSSTYQCQNFGCNLSYKSNYPLFGITINMFEKNEFPLSFKAKNAMGSQKYLKKVQEGETYVQSVNKIDNEYFLKQNEFIYDITTETSTFLMNNILVHNCASISMYPFLLSGMEKLGGEAKAPKHLSSFSGNFVNLCFAISAQLAGAVGVPEFLNCFDYFARKDYGEDYATWFSNPNATPEQKAKAKEIENHLQSIVYAINQPAAARGFQSIFCNWSVFDKYYFDAIFSDFVFPDCTKPNWESLDKLQRFFLSWFNKERTKALLTFPVVTASVLTKDGKPRDEEFSRFLCKELSEGNAFFVFMSENPSAISSCCRLSNEMTDTTFSSSLGAGGVSTGSMNVITLNINRLVQNSVKDNSIPLDERIEAIKKAVAEQTYKIHMYQKAFKSYLDDLKNSKMLPIYDAGFVTMKKQYLTVGINGLLEGGEYLGLEPNMNEDYKKYVIAVVQTINDINKAERTEDIMFNLEMVPAENLGVKFAGWDKKAGYKVGRDCYNSYLYKAEDSKITIIDKMKLYSTEISKHMSGGSALHLALEEYPNEDAYYKLMCMAAKLGVPYWCTNISITCCEEDGCKHINKNTSDHCVKCGSTNVSHATRIIGYLRKEISFSKERKIENKLRYYTKIFNRDIEQS